MVSIVILTHNKLELTERCIDSIYSFTNPNSFELIVVDNASTDATCKFLAKQAKKHKNLKIFYNQENLSFSKACNQGAMEATGNYILFLNNDTWVTKTWLDKLVKPMEKDGEIGIVGSKLLYPNEKIQHAGVELGLWGHPFHRGLNLDKNNTIVSEARDVFAVTGACLLIKKAIFQRVSGFDESYVYGLEDIDLCLKVRKEGYKILYVPDCVVYHHELTTGPKKYKKPNEIKNESVFIRKWGKDIEKMRERFIKNLKEKNVKRIVIYGMGKAAEISWKRLSDEGFQLLGFLISDNEKKEKMQSLSSKVFSYNDMFSLDYDAILICSQFMYTIKERLLNKGLKEKIVLPLIA